MLNGWSTKCFQPTKHSECFLQNGRKLGQTCTKIRRGTAVSSMMVEQEVKLQAKKRQQLKQKLAA
jgi:hypothetical protein